MEKLSVRDLDVKGRRVLVRVDFNVPTEEIDGKIRITDDTRIRGSLPTIEILRAEGAKVILLAHFGRPKGKPNPKYSLKPVADYLATLIEPPVSFSPEVIGPKVEALSKALPDGGVLLVENVRFFPGEEANADSFAQAIAKLGDVYVDDAFGTAHRAHASTAGVAKYLPQAAMGLLMERELQYLKDELANPERPFLVILGGAKVSDKIGVIKALMEKADVFLIGGAMAYTFYKALGIPTGASRVEADKVHLAEEILALAKKKGVKFLLPVDDIETRELKPGAESRNTPVHSSGSGITDGWQGVDIGRETIARYKAEISEAKTILWNGPVGVFEIPDFAIGTKELAEALAVSKATTIIGGGDSVTAVNQFGLAAKMTFISTGGGASLELLEGKELPGVAALTDRSQKTEISHMKVGAIVKKKVPAIWSIEPKAMVIDAIQLMDEKNVGALPVVDNGKLVGIVSERDYTRKVILKGRSSKDTPVSDIMTTQLVTVNRSDSVSECMRIMTEKHVRHLPVLEGANLVGILSMGDVVNWLISAQGATIDNLERYVTGDYPP